MRASTSLSSVFKSARFSLTKSRAKFINTLVVSIKFFACS